MNSSPTQKKKMKPDIMIVELDTHNGPGGELDYLQESTSATRPPLPPTIKKRRPLGGFRFETVERPRKLWLLEGGYCADTKVQDKIDEKMEQHGTLRELLLEYGYHCIYSAFPLGHAGAIYKANFSVLTEQLGVPKTEARTMLKKLHMHAIIFFFFFGLQDSCPFLSSKKAVNDTGRT